MGHPPRHAGPAPGLLAAPKRLCGHFGGVGGPSRGVPRGPHPPGGIFDTSSAWRWVCRRSEARLAPSGAPPWWWGISRVCTRAHIEEPPSCSNISGQKCIQMRPMRIFGGFCPSIFGPACITRRVHTAGGSTYRIGRGEPAPPTSEAPQTQRARFRAFSTAFAHKPLKRPQKSNPT